MKSVSGLDRFVSVLCCLEVIVMRVEFPIDVMTGKGWESIGALLESGLSTTEQIARELVEFMSTATILSATA